MEMSEQVQMGLKKAGEKQTHSLECQALRGAFLSAPMEE